MIDMQVLKARAAARLKDQTQTADVANPANWLMPDHLEAQPISQLATLASAAACDAPAATDPPTDALAVLSASARAAAGTLEWLAPVTGALDAQNLATALGWRPGEVWAALRELERSGLARRGRDLAWRLRLRQEGLTPTSASPTPPPSGGATERTTP